MENESNISSTQMSSSTTAKKKSRNAWIDSWRVIAALAIMYFHFPPDVPFKVASGGLFVEFFFMLSGYFALTHLFKNIDKERAVFAYMKKFFIRVFPYALAGTSLAYIGIAIACFPHLTTFLKKACFFPFDAMLFQCTGMYPSNYYVLWYLSITVICLPIVLYAAKRCKSIWWYVVLIVPLVLYGYLLSVNGTVRVNSSASIDLWLRAIAGLLSGGLLILLSQNLSTRDYSKHQKNLLLTLELLSLALACYLITIPELSKTRFDSLVIVLFIVTLAISLSGQTSTSKLRAPFLDKWLGNMSLAIYCLHWGVFKILNSSDIITSHDLQIACGYVTTIVLSFLLVFILNWRDKRKSGK